MPSANRLRFFSHPRRRKLWRSGTFILAGVHLLTWGVQPIRAEDGWGSLLKPLIRDVIIPGAKYGVEKWGRQEDGEKTAATPAPTPAPQPVVSSTQSGSPPPMLNIDDNGEASPMTD